MKSLKYTERYTHLRKWDGFEKAYMNASLIIQFPYPNKQMYLPKHDRLSLRSWKPFLHLHWYEPNVFVQSCEQRLSLHSFISVQFFLSLASSYPDLHIHSNFPLLFKQRCAQPPFFFEHSSQSKRNIYKNISLLKTLI